MAFLLCLCTDAGCSTFICSQFSASTRARIAVNNRCEALKDYSPNQIKKKSETKKPGQPINWGTGKMTTPAIWPVYTLMFGYPVPTLSSPQFTNQTSCLV
jgi:hypothetical protein